MIYSYYKCAIAGVETACGKRLKVNYRKKVRLGDVLVKKGIIDENQLQTALSRQREQGKMLGEMVIATVWGMNLMICERRR